MVSDLFRMNTGKIAALAGMSAVALGAFGAHLLKSRLAAAGTTAIWQTGVQYHLIHAVCLLALCFAPTPCAKALRVASRAWLLGILLFSGSLYFLALGAPSTVGMITPLGGLAFIIGWGALFVWSINRE